MAEARPRNSREHLSHEFGRRMQSMIPPGDRIEHKFSSLNMTACIGDSPPH